MKHTLKNKWLGIILYLIQFLLCACSRAELPPFNNDREKALSAEKRQHYDVIFFNEIEVWNLNSNRYGKDSAIKRRAEFERMAQDGYFPAYAALRLAGIWPATLRHDPEALEMLLKRAEEGDASAMCASNSIPKELSLWGSRDRIAINRKYMIDSAAKGHGACMAYYGGALLLGNLPGIPTDRKAAMPLLLKSAADGYYVAAKRLFSLRYSKALRHEFDFADRAELERALCWGRLAQQHTNWAGFEMFLELLHGYARANNRTDLIQQSKALDPLYVPIVEKIVQPQDCIRLEKEETP